MTAGHHREIDPDLLADYIGGALAGTQQEATVERLIADDPAWRRAHADLARAVTAVEADLSTWASALTEPMPAEVAERLDALFRADGAGSPTTTTAASAPATEGGPVTSAPAAQGQGPQGQGPSRGGPGRRPTAVPGTTRPGGARNRRSAPGRRRWSRLAGPVAVAAAVVAFTGFGINQLVTMDGANDTATSGYAESGGGEAVDSAGGAEGPPRALAQPPAQRLLATGTDYTPATLGTVGLLDSSTASSAQTRAAPSIDREGETAPDLAPADTPPGLRRLADPTALTGCLRAVAAEHARGPLTVELVDYATFQATPALIVLFTDPARERWAWAAGPACGLPGSGADTRHRSRVG